MASQAKIEDHAGLAWEHWSELADAAATPLRLFGPDGACILVNQAWLVFAGGSRERYLGLRWLEAIHPEDRHRCAALVAQLASGEPAPEISYRLLPAGGSDCAQVVEHMSTISSAAGTGPYYVGTARADVRPVAVRAKDGPAGLHRQLLDAAGEAIVATDLAGRVTYWNHGAEALYGWSTDEAIGRPVTELNVPEASREQAAEIMAAVGRGEPWSGEFPVTGRSGRRFLAHVENRLVYDESGTAVGIVGVSFDLSERDALVDGERAARDELQSALEQLETSELHLRRIVDANVVGVAYGDGDLITDANDAFLQIIGYSRDELQAGALDIRAITPREFAEADQRAQIQCLANGYCPPYEKDYTRPDGQCATVFQGLALVQRSPYRWACIALDQTERRRVEDDHRFLAAAGRTLAASLDMEATLENAVGLAVPRLADFCLLDLVQRDGSILRVAAAHRDPSQSGLVQDRVRLQPDVDARHVVVQTIRSGVPEVIADITPDVRERIGVSAGHDPIQTLAPTSLLCVPLIARGKTLGAMTFVYSAPSGRQFTGHMLPLADDLARRTALAIDNAVLYRDARKTADRLHQANQVKDEFLGLVSHELRTPITTIFGNAQILRRLDKTIDEQERAAALADIEQEAMRLQRLIDNMLVLSRVEAGGHTVLEPTLVQHIVRRVVALHRHRFPLREIVTDLPKDLPAVSAEPTYFEQILQNLISNAEKYSEAGKPIEVRVRAEGVEVTIGVVDGGIGIDPEETDEIFAPFYRSNRTAAYATGAGIGLAVCKRLTEAQGGRIWAKAREGGGSEFWFALGVDTEAE